MTQLVRAERPARLPVVLGPLYTATTAGGSITKFEPLMGRRVTLDWT